VEECAKRVMSERKRAWSGQRAFNVTLGVEPTVGFASALVIFILVGTFAAGIAWSFQLVNWFSINVLIALNHIRLDSTFITTRIIWIQPLTQGEK